MTTQALRRVLVPPSTAVETIVLPVLFQMTIGVLDVLADLPSILMVSLMLVGVAASVRLGGRPGGLIALTAAAIGAFPNVAPLDLATLIGAGASVIAVVAPLRDSIERSEAVRQAGAEAREWLRQILDRIPHPVVVWDRDGRLTFANESAARVVGMSPAAAVDLPATLRGEEHGPRELSVPAADGGPRTVVSTARALRSTGGVVGAVATFVDVTDMRSLEQERAEFFAMLGHELKTPLTSVYGQAQMIRRLIDRGGSPEQLRAAAEELDVAIGRMRDLTAEISDLTTMRAGHFVLAPREVDLRLVVRSAAARNAARSDRHHVDVRVPDREVVVRCDEFRVEQVLDNLIANAVHYSPNGGRVRLTLDIENVAAVVRVSDEGMGVPTGERHRIFEPFFRASNARSRRGTGLGLAISRDIARRSGGDLRLERTGPHGSTFLVTLPLAAGRAVTTEAL